MLLFIILNMTPFYVEKKMSQLCPKQPHALSQCTPHIKLLYQIKSKSNQISLLAYNCNSYNIYQESKKTLH